MNCVDGVDTIITIDPDNSTPSIFTACFIEKFGISALTARAVVASIAGSSNT